VIRAILVFAAALPLAASAIELETPGGDAVRFETGEASATAVVFISTVCPIANDYHDRFERLHRDFASRRVRLLFVYANYNESGADVRRHAAEARFSFSVYRDPAQRLANLLEARFTPTAVVLDAGGRVRYFGAVDDAVNPARVKTPYLARAMEAVLNGRDPSPGVTRTVG
jgi:hypothetical protein